jgi:hypothetical protein
MATEAQKNNMRMALRVMHDVEIVGDVDVRWWPHVPRAIAMARGAGAVCTSCKGRVTLTHTTVVVNPQDSRDGRFIHFCKLCGETPEAVAEGVKLVLEMKVK